MGWMKWLGLLVATLTVLVVGLMAYGSWRWNVRSTTLIARLEEARAVRHEAHDQHRQSDHKNPEPFHPHHDGILD